MTDEQVCETVEKYGVNQEECARLNASLTCLRNVHMAGACEGTVGQQGALPRRAAEPGQQQSQEGARAAPGVPVQGEGSG